MLSFRPWAIECLLGDAWTYTLSSALLLVAPWATTVLTAAAVRALPRRRVELAAACCVLLDLVSTGAGRSAARCCGGTVNGGRCR